MSEKIRVAVIDDHPMMREGIIHTLSADPELDVVAEGADAETARKVASVEQPRVMLLDISMPGGGLAAAKDVTASNPGVRVIMLTVSESQRHLQEAMEAGAHGYVLKGVGGDELKQAVKRVAAGQRYFSPELVSLVLEQRDNNALSELTPREAEILELICEGLTNKEIGDKLTLTEKSVKYYLTNMFRKLGVRNRVEAAMLANTQRGE
jgi:DNA-binding NarL/FixJ family response regulator